MAFDYKRALRTSLSIISNSLGAPEGSHKEDIVRVLAEELTGMGVVPKPPKVIKPRFERGPAEFSVGQAVFIQGNMAGTKHNTPCVISRVLERPRSWAYVVDLGDGKNAMVMSQVRLSLTETPASAEDA